jgi:pimeloyl-ACP methyl ester carboxylesterase
MTASRTLGLVTLAMSAVLSGCKQVQDSLLYHPVPVVGAPPAPPPGWRVEELSLKRPGEFELRGWLLKATEEPAPLLLYFGGNAEELSWQIASVDRMGARAVALVNYRGYGQSTGSPSESALLGDALALYDALVRRPDLDANRVAVMGRSLGTGAAVHVAANRPIERAVVVSPYDSIEAVAGAHFPAFLVRMVLTDRYDAGALAPSIRVPMLAVATRDEVIPIERSKRLYALWGGPKRWVELPHATHTDVQEFPDYWRTIAGFLAER